MLALHPTPPPSLWRFEKLKNLVTVLEFAMTGGRGHSRLQAESPAFIVISVIVQILLERKRWENVELEQTC